MLEAPPPPDSRIARLSREFAFACTSDGMITWADSRAQQALGWRAGQVLAELAVDGEAEKVDHFLLAARDGLADAWELALIAHGEPRTLTVRAEPYDHGVLVVGDVQADSYGALQAAATGIASELATLQREAERKRRELDAARLVQQKLMAREREAHAIAEAARERITLILETINDAFLGVDLDGRVTYANSRAGQLFGRNRWDLTGQTVDEALPPVIAKVLLEATGAVGQAAQTFQRDVQMDERVWLEIRAYSAGQELSVFLTDISARKAQEERTQFFALHDPLTGLLNRRGFDEALQRVGDRAHRGAPGVLMMLDLDRFKRINDTAGHPAGDEALRRVAELLRLAVRPNDIIARQGGDEFAVVLPETPLETGVRIAARLLHTIRDFRLDWFGYTFDLGLSVGVASIDGTSSEAIIARADAALYRAKEGGRDRVEVDDGGVEVSKVLPAG